MKDVPRSNITNVGKLELWRSETGKGYILSKDVLSSQLPLWASRVSPTGNWGTVSKASTRVFPPEIQGIIHQFLQSLVESSLSVALPDC